MQTVQQTDYDAFSSKLACLSKGYLPPNEQSLITPIKGFVSIYQGYKDLHLQYFQALKGEFGGRRLASKINRSIQNSQPVMNYGTYLRTLSIDIPLLSYINEIAPSEQCQIVNLGCGSDLRCSQFVDKGEFPQVMKYIDLDFKQSIEFKQSVLQKLPQGPSNDIYEAVSCDLNNIDETMSVLTKLLKADIPTVFITECALCYMPQEESQILIDSIRKTFNTGVWLSYDPIGGDEPNDRFGKIMKDNLLMSRNLDLPTLLIFNSKDTYSNRWSQYEQVTIQNMWDFLQSTISPIEQKRLQSVQFLDEIEELRIMQSHYVTMKAQW